MTDSAARPGDPGATDPERGLSVDSTLQGLGHRGSVGKPALSDEFEPIEPAASKPASGWKTPSDAASPHQSTATRSAAAVGVPSADSAPPEAPSTEFSGVYLLTTGPDGPTAVAGLRLSLGDQGATLTKPDFTKVWSANWTEIESLSTPERSTLPDGAPGVVLMVTPRLGRSHRFVIPASEAGALEEIIESTAVSHGLAAHLSDRQPNPFVVGLLVAVVALIVAGLLLVAGHVMSL